MPSLSPDRSRLPVRQAGAVRIAGAGPSGLAAGLILAKKGFSVEIHEAKPGIGTRWKRGLQVIENFSEKDDVLESFRDAGIETNFQARPVTRITLWDGRGRKAAFESGVPLGYYVKRGAAEGALDRGLLDQALGAGVRFFFNSTRDPDSVDIVSTGPRRVDGIGKEATFPTALSDRMTVILDPELAPGGYAYLFVLGGEATLGMAILDGFRSVDGFFTKTVRRFEEIEGVRVDAGEESTAVANFFLGSSGPQKGVIRIGEAAGFQDYLFGFGIRFAVESAAMAAKSVAEGIPFERLARRLKKRQEASLWNRFLYEKGRAWLPGVFIALAERSPDFRDYMRSWYRHHPLKSLAVGLVRRSWKHRKLDWNGVGDAERTGA